jgi:glyoxylase-like metal-dependent hydrolase (beta-lactamase superfamily II)
LNAANPGPLTGAGNWTYLLARPGGAAMLIDAGIGERRHLDDLAAALGDTRGTLTALVATHAHADHVGGAAAIAAAHPDATLRKYPWPEEDARSAVAWSGVADGDRLDAGGEPLVVLHTPGHSPDHIVLFHEASRTVFSGDLVIAGSSVVIQASRGGSLRLYLAALERVRQLGASRLLPAHGPEIDDPEAILSEYIAHRQMREQQIVAALSGGRRTVPAIAESIYDDLAPALASAARENVRAHLEKLREEDRVAVEGQEFRLL